MKGENAESAADLAGVLGHGMNSSMTVIWMQEKKDGALSVHGLRFRSSKPVKARVDNQKFRIGNLQAGSFEPACTGFLDFSANYSQQK